jgi:hypothetical protein
MDPTLVFGAITAVDSTERRLRPARPAPARRPPAHRLRRGAARRLHRLADRVEPTPICAPCA